MNNDRNNLNIGIVSIASAVVLTILFRIIFAMLPLTYQLMPQVDILIAHAILCYRPSAASPIALCAIGIVTDICSGAVCGLSSLGLLIAAETVSARDSRPIILLKIILVSGATKWGALSLIQLGLFSPQSILMSLVDTLIVYVPTTFAIKSIYRLTCDKNHNLRIDAN